MTNTVRDLILLICVLATLPAGYLFSSILRYYLPGPAANGVGFFAAFLLLYAVLGKRARWGPWMSLALCLIAGIIAFLGELIWRSR